MPEKWYSVILSTHTYRVDVLAESKEDAENQGMDYWYSNVVPAVEVEDA